MKRLAIFSLLAVVTVLVRAKNTRNQANSLQVHSPSSESDLNKIYKDESHCLVGPEIRSESDDSISCYCRDSIVDARYVWQTYLITDKDPNLNGPDLTLESDAKQMCGKQSDVYKAMIAEHWEWNGPEVVRTYPPDEVIRQIKPDSHGIIHYEYTVVVLQRDLMGHVVKTESFTARDMIPLALISKPKQQE